MAKANDAPAWVTSLMEKFDKVFPDNGDVDPPEWAKAIDARIDKILNADNEDATEPDVDEPEWSKTLSAKLDTMITPQTKSNGKSRNVPTAPTKRAPRTQQTPPTDGATPRRSGWWSS